MPAPAIGTPERAAWNARRNAARKNRRAVEGKSARTVASTCPACTGTGRLHDCEDFPLPAWSADYCDAFTRALEARPVVPGVLVDRITRPMADAQGMRTVVLPMRQEVRVTLPVADSLTRYPDAPVVVGPTASTHHVHVSKRRPMFGPLTVRQGMSTPKRLPLLDSLPSEHPCKDNGVRCASLNLCIGRSPEGHLLAARIS
jgi:hypothetical protein